MLLKKINEDEALRMFDIGIRCCEAQRSVFEYAVKKGFDIKSFSDLYLKSDFCKRAFD